MFEQFELKSLLQFVLKVKINVSNQTKKQIRTKTIRYKSNV